MIKKNKQVFILATCFIPFVIVISEFTLAIFTTFAGIKLPNKNKHEVNHSYTFDLITGTTRYQPSKKDLEKKK